MLLRECTIRSSLYYIPVILLIRFISETTSNGSVDLSKSAPEKLPAFVAAAKKNVRSTLATYIYIEQSSY